MFNIMSSGFLLNKNLITFKRKINHGFSQIYINLALYSDFKAQIYFLVLI